MIGIGVKRTSGGGAQFVTTTYLDSFEETLAAGFTCASGNKYAATRKALDNMWSQYAAAKQLLQTSVIFLRFDNSTVTLTLENALIDLNELEANFYNARTYDSYTYL